MDREVLDALLRIERRMADIVDLVAAALETLTDAGDEAEEQAVDLDGSPAGAARPDGISLG